MNIYEVSYKRTSYSADLETVKVAARTIVQAIDGAAKHIKKHSYVKEIVGVTRILSDVVAVR